MLKDKVRVSFGIGVEYESGGNVPIYQLEKDSNGNLAYDPTGNVIPKSMGGAKSGSIGTLENGPLKTDKRYLKGLRESATSLGAEPMMMFEVYFEHYKQKAWVASEHVKIIG